MFSSHGVTDFPTERVGIVHFTECAGNVTQIKFFSKLESRREKWVREVLLSFFLKFFKNYVYVSLAMCI